MRFLAKAISIIFHPLLLTTYLVALLSLRFPTMLMLRLESIKLVIAFVFCFTFILPSVNLLMLRFFGTVTSLALESREQRFVPFTFIALIYLLIAFLFFFKFPFSDSFNRLMVVVALLVTSATVATFFLKVSVHSLAMAGMLGVLLPLNKGVESSVLLWPTAITVVLCGVVMSARLYLQAHTPREILWGGVIGFSVSFSSMIILY